MNAFELAPHKVFCATAGKVWRGKNSATGIIGPTFLASLNANATIELEFQVPRAIPSMGDCKLEVCMVATISSGTSLAAQFQIKWATVQKGISRTSLSAGTNLWTASGTNDEYYKTADPNEPSILYIEGVAREKGTVGSLGGNQWGWSGGSLYVKMNAAPWDPDDHSSDQNFIEMSEPGESAVPSLSSEGNVTVVWPGTSSTHTNKLQTFVTPLDVVALQAGEWIKMELIGLTSGWTMNADLTIESIKLIWEETT